MKCQEFVRVTWDYRERKFIRYGDKMCQNTAHKAINGKEVCTKHYNMLLRQMKTREKLYLLLRKHFGPLNAHDVEDFVQEVVPYLNSSHFLAERKSSNENTCEIPTIR